jgi:GAF domain-containing protein
METNAKPQNRILDVLIRVWRFLTAAHPSITEVGERRRAQLISVLSLLLTFSFITALLSSPSSLQIFFIFLAITLVTYILSRTRYYWLSAIIVSFGFTSLAYITIYTGSASSIDSAISSIVPVSLILASAILSRKGFLILVIMSVVATITVSFYADPALLEDPNLSLGRTIGITVSTGLLLLGITTFLSSVERARLREMQNINIELESMTASLEKRVNERTDELEKANQQTSRRAAQLQTVTSLSEAISEYNELREIFPAATRLISERFGFYHVGIFLVDPNKEFAVLQAANSDGGKRMLARNHRLRLGTGVVGFAAQFGQPRIALDVGADAVFFDNPDLPDTRSEAALPLKARGETIGVLDVQSTEPGAFSTEDLQVLTTLANQVSIAFENARLLTDARAALAQAEDVYNEFTRTEWTRANSLAEQAGFRYQEGRIELVERDLRTPEVISAVEKGSIVALQAQESETERAVMAVPVKLRGEVIGVLHIESSDPSQAWNSDDLAFIESVAERAALAMENARLFQDARRRAAKEQFISDASARISSALNMENILQTTAEELERVLGGSEVWIQFQNKEQV